MLACENLSLDVQETNLLSNVSAEVVSGAITIVIGPNGAGKSSLLRVLAGELMPSSGDIFLNTRNLRDLTLKEAARVRSVMSQSPNIVFDFSVKDVVLFGWPDDRAICWDTVEEVALSSGIQALLPRRFNSLSGGERQRVHFARALLQLRSGGKELAGKFMLLDEPTSSLDIAHSLHLLFLIKQTATHGLGALVVLHDLNLAARFADHVILMAQGRIARQGNVEYALNANVLSEVYGTKIIVERHQVLDRLVIYA